MLPRCVLLAATVAALGAACADDERAPDPPPPSWVYAPPPVLWQSVPLVGKVGRSQAPQLVTARGLVGDVTSPLGRPTPWTVPGDGPARAIVSGNEGIRAAVELVDVDAGRVVWRDTKHCAAPVVGVTAEVAVCADAKGTRAIGLDGKPRWTVNEAFVAITDERVVLGTGPDVRIIEANDGSELARVTLPAGAIAEEIVASCGDSGRELFASREDALVRIAEAKGGPAISWRVGVGGIAELDACSGETIVVTTASSAGGAASLLAVTRANGAIANRIDGVLGRWRARDGGDGFEVALAHGLRRFDRALSAPGEPLDPRTYGPLIAERGPSRLVRTSPLTAVLLDERGVRAYLPFASVGAVIGASTILAATWTGSPSETVRRIDIPERYRKQLRMPSRRAGVAVPAELRDLPPDAVLDLETAIGKPDTGKHRVVALALDPAVPNVLYTAALERVPDDDSVASVAAVDLSKRAWRWQRADGCGTGVPVGLAVATDVIVCAARTASPASVPLATVRATSHDGAARWEWEGVHVDGVEAIGDIVIVRDANMLHVLDARTGRTRARIASDDGAPVRAALISHLAPAEPPGVGRLPASTTPTTYLVTYERGRIVVRVPVLEGVAFASLAVDGVVRELAAVAGGVHVALEDGDAYHVDLDTFETVALPGLDLGWSALGDLVGGATAGGPIPNLAKPAAPPPVVRDRFGRPIDCVRFRLLPACRAAAAGRPVPRVVVRPVPRPIVRRDPRNPVAPGEPDGPRLWTPIAAAPPLGDSWQLSLYEAATGTLRARNDYALYGAVSLSRVRGPAGSPLVVASGEGLREVLVLDPRNGDPIRKVQLPAEAAPGLVFGTVVDGTPVAGAVLAAPLRVIVL